MAGSSRPPLVIRCEKMRIAWVLSISRIRKAGKSLTAPGGPGSPGVDLAGRGWARPSSRVPTWPLSCLGCAIADDLYSRQRRATRNGCEMRQEAPRLRVWRENATQVAMVQLLYCHVVASILVAWPIQGNSHNHLCIKNSCQKQIFKKAEKLGNTKLPEMTESDRSPQSRFLLSFLLSGNGEQQVETGFPVLYPVLAPETNRDHMSRCFFRCSAPEPPRRISHCFSHCYAGRPPQSNSACYAGKTGVLLSGALSGACTGNEPSAAELVGPVLSFVKRCLRRQTTPTWRKQAV